MNCSTFSHKNLLNKFLNTFLYKRLNKVFNKFLNKAFYQRLNKVFNPRLNPRLN
ncbi:MAG: hypothetical protein ACTSU9_12550 [Promethearchaeota archaeon]